MCREALSKILAVTVRSIDSTICEMRSVEYNFGAGHVPTEVAGHRHFAGQQCSNDAVVCTEAVSY